MKANQAQWMLAVLVATTLASSAAMAQGSLAANSAPAATAGTPAPQLAYGVPQILQLAQAKVGDDMIIAYIRNSGNSYRLNVDQIIYLRQQDLSDAVITAMLNQPRAGVALPLPTTPAPPPVAATAAAGTTSADAAYPQTPPGDCYYSEPYYNYYDPGCCYPGYVGYPPVTIGLGWGSGGWYGGRYYGGYRGGWHGGGFGGGWHGGSFGGARHVGGFGGGGHVGGFARVGQAGGFGGGGHVGGRR